ncbi:MAG: hypothetical protein KDC68_06110 [Gelidibacter sp.]|nr:hypothetical protein [Gelidibacter sp.]
MNTPDEGQNIFVNLVSKSQPTSAQQGLSAMWRISIVPLVGRLNRMAVTHHLIQSLSKVVTYQTIRPTALTLLALALIYLRFAFGLFASF